MVRIKAIFEQDFREWQIKLPQDAFEFQVRGEIKAKGWHIYYVFGENARGAFMDYLAWHRRSGEPTHKRIYATGEEELLPSYIGFISHPANATQAEIDRIGDASAQYNQRVSKLLDMKGFNPPDHWAGDKNMKFEVQTKKEMEKLFRLFRGGRG